MRISLILLPFWISIMRSLLYCCPQGSISMGSLILLPSRINIMRIPLILLPFWISIMRSLLHCCPQRSISMGSLILLPSRVNIMRIHPSDTAAFLDQHYEISLILLPSRVNINGISNAAAPCFYKMKIFCHSPNVATLTLGPDTR